MSGHDVIVIGGGIVGTTAAFFLRPKRRVLLLERGQVGQQASGVNFGNVRRQGRDSLEMPLANRAMEIWGSLDRLIGTDCEFLRHGHLRVSYSDRDAGELEAYAREMNRFGLGIEMLAPGDLRARYPYLSGALKLGSLSPFDGHANPRLLTPAFARAAIRAGVEIRENAPVAAIEAGAGGVRVTTADGRSYRAENVILSAGAWTARMAAALGESFPLAVKGPQMGVTEPLPYRVRPAIVVHTRHTPDMIYFRQVERGNIVFGGCGHGPASAETNRSHVDPAVTAIQIEKLSRLLPGIAGVSVLRLWSGIESYFPDHMPVIGESRTVPGLLYAFGFSGHGFQIGPGVGQTLAEMIVTGRSSVPIGRYAPGRFSRPPPER